MGKCNSISTKKNYNITINKELNDKKEKLNQIKIIDLKPPLLIKTFKF